MKSFLSILISSLKIFFFFQFEDLKIGRFQVEKANAWHLWEWGPRPWGGMTPWTFSPAQPSAPAVKDTTAPLGTAFISLKPETSLAAFGG